MTGHADANLVIAATNREDALHDRAVKHLTAQGRLQVPFSVGIELLLVARRREAPLVTVVGAADALFDLEERDVLFTAAEALDEREVTTVFDAVHLAVAFHRGQALHTADAKLHRSAFPTVAF